MQGGELRHTPLWSLVIGQKTSFWCLKVDKIFHLGYYRFGGDVQAMKVNVTLDDALMKRVDDYADRNYMSRSGLLSLAVTQYLNANEMVLAISDMALSMRKIADTGKIDHETIEQLEDFERLANLLSGNIK